MSVVQLIMLRYRGGRFRTATVKRLPVCSPPRHRTHVHVRKTLAAINVRSMAPTHMELRVHDVEKCYGTPLAVPCE